MPADVYTMVVRMEHKVQKALAKKLFTSDAVQWEWEGLCLHTPAKGVLLHLLGAQLWLL